MEEVDLEELLELMRGRAGLIVLDCRGPDGPQQLTEENEDFILNFGKPIDLVFTNTTAAAVGEELRQRLKTRVHSLAAADGEWLKELSADTRGALKIQLGGAYGKD